MNRREENEKQLRKDSDLIRKGLGIIGFAPVNSVNRNNAIWRILTKIAYSAMAWK